MFFSIRLHVRRLLMPATMAVILSAAGVAMAQPIVVEFDGRDQANLVSEGNHPTFHANVNFAFTYVDVSAVNLSPNPPGPSSASFLFTSTNNAGGGAIGFGTNQLAFPAATSFAELSLTVNPDNRVPWIYVLLKDADLPTFATEDLQYRVDIPAAPGTYVLTKSLAVPTFVNNLKDGIPNFDGPLPLGLSEVHIQYPFGAHGSPGPFMDLTIHSLKIRTIPEPASLALLGLSAVACGIGLRRRR